MSRHTPRPFKVVDNTDRKIPQPATVGERKKMVLGAFETLIQAEEQGILDNEFKAAVIYEAWDYAKKNKLPYDGTFRGAMKLAEQADRLVQDFHALEEKQQRADTEEHRRNKGYSGSMRVKDLLQ